MIIYSEQMMLTDWDYGTKTSMVSFRTNKKFFKTLEIFKQKIRYLKLNNCPCRFFKTYIEDLGYL